MKSPNQDDIQENIIKNPKRNVVEEQQQQNSYIPEYIRLGLNPIPQLIQDYSSLDGELVDDNANSIIDNNDVINYSYISSSNKNTTKTTNDSNTDGIPNINDYILMLYGKLICSGNEDKVLSEARSLVYGEHPMFTNQNINSADIIILKRVALKVGVFIDD